MFLVLFAFAGGYYRGYQDRSRISSSFELEWHLAVYDQLQRNNLALARGNLQVAIEADSSNLKSIRQTPLGNFVSEFEYSFAGDQTKNLAWADRITKETDSPSPASK